MKREEAKANLTTILGGVEPTDEQITSYLDTFHNATKTLSDSLETANNTIADLNGKVTNLTQSEIELNAIKQSQLTAEEKIAQKEKEIEQRLASARMTDNRAKVKEILSEVGGVDETVLNAIVTDDEVTSVKNANAILTQIKNIQLATETKTKQDLATLNIKPVASNTSNDNAMTWEKFDQMSADEQSKFAEEHPDIMEKL